MARPSKINGKVIFTNPIEGTEEELTITDAFCRYLAAGAYIGHTCEALGISEKTLSNWLARGREHDQPAESKIPARERPFVAFLHATTRARAQGIAWHEWNVRRHAEVDGKLSLEYLARRAPGQYAKRIEVDTDPGEREPAPLDAELALRAEEAFDAANVPDGIDPASILPELAE